jgi:hypothetical protein
MSRSPLVRHHDGVADHRASRAVGERGGDRAHHVRRAEHAQLGGVHHDVGEQRRQLLGDELRRYAVDAGDTAGVLRGQRGEHRRPVDAEGAERLEVGLDAGAAAGVAARHGQRCRHPRPPADHTRAPSIDTRSARAAAAGSGAAHTAETTHTPSTPVVATSAARLASMPPIATVPEPGGTGGVGQRTDAVRAEGAAGVGLGRRRPDRADADHVHGAGRQGAGDVQLRDGGDAEPEQPVGPQQGADLGRGQVVLAEVHAVDAGEQRDVDRVVRPTARRPDGRSAPPAPPG